MKPAYYPSQVVYVSVGHPAFAMGEEAVVTSSSQVDSHAPILYRVKDVWGRWHWLEAWQLSPRPLPDETRNWESAAARPTASLLPSEAGAPDAAHTHRLFWCTACESATPAADWLLNDGRCPSCSAPTPDHSYRFHPLPCRNSPRQKVTPP